MPATASSPYPWRSGDRHTLLPADSSVGPGVGRTRPAIATASLEPGDSVLFYTDGAIEGKASSGGGFGLERLVDLVGQTASDQLAAEEVVRRIGRAVLEHHSERLDDDATLVMVQWAGAS